MLVEFYTAGSALRILHVACATLSLALFALRGAWMLVDSPQLARRWVRVVPHIVDTVFLAAGIGLAVRLQQYPFEQGWLTAKVFGLIGYIVLGSLALKPGRPKALRAATFVAALAMFGYIVGVACARNPWSWLAFIAP